METELKPVPTESEIRKYFQQAYRLAEDKPIVYPVETDDVRPIKLQR